MKKPYIFIVTATSIDGKISTFERKQSEIATNDDKRLAYVSRIRADAVMIGGTSICFDDPKLTLKKQEDINERVRLGKSEQPLTVAVITNADDIELKGEYLRTKARKVIFTTDKTEPDILKKLKEKKDISVYIFGKERVDLKQALNQLYLLGVRELMVEGGGELNFSLLKDNLVDEINLKVGNLILGGKCAPTLADGEGFTQREARQFKLVDCEQSDSYVILKYLKN